MGRERPEDRGGNVGKKFRQRFHVLSTEYDSGTSCMVMLSRTGRDKDVYLLDLNGALVFHRRKHFPHCDHNMEPGRVAQSGELLVEGKFGDRPHLFPFANNSFLSVVRLFPE